MSKPAVDDDLAARLRRVVTRLNRMSRHEVAGDLTLTLQAAMVTIAKREPIGLSALAAVEGVAPPTVTKMIDRLEADGLVRRSADPADGRATLVTCTEAGREWVDDQRNRRTAWLADRLAGLAPGDEARLAAAIPVLEKLIGEAG